MLTCSAAYSLAAVWMFVPQIPLAWLTSNILELRHVITKYRHGLTDLCCCGGLCTGTIFEGPVNHGK